MKKLLLLFAIAASVFSISCDGVFDDLHGRINPGDQNDFYVAPDGDDNHPGWKAYPMATIGRAIEKATAGDRIHVMAGTYNESVTLKDGVSLYGSYSNHNYNAASRNVIANPSIIIADSTTGGIYSSGAITQDIVVDSFEIVGLGTTTTGTPSYGFNLAGSGTSQTITVQRCKIICGDSPYRSCGINLNTSQVFINNNIIITPSGSSPYAYGIYSPQNSTANIYNNTIDFSESNTLWRGIYIKTDDTVSIINNIINVRTGDNHIGIHRELMINTITALENNNIYLNTGTTNGFLFNGSGLGTGIQDIDEVNALSFANANIDTDPQFHEIDENFYQLETGSPAASAGQNLYGEGITIDIVGNPRPETGSTTGWSIGAYQYQE